MCEDSTDWSLCVLCQEDDVGLRDPYKVTRKDMVRTDEHGETHIQGYETLSNNIITLNNLNAMPMEINIKRLDEGSGIERTLTNKHAKWHEACYKKFNNKEVKRVERALRKNKIPTTPVTPVVPVTPEIHTTPVKKKLRLSTPREKVKKSTTCFFCDKELLDGSEIRKNETFSFYENVQLIANVLQDRKLIGKLSQGDTIATEAEYHLKCYHDLRNSYRSVQRKANKTTYSPIHPETEAFSNLVAYIEEYGDEVSTFKLSDLVNYYTWNLEALGAHSGERVHITRSKDDLSAVSSPQPSSSSCSTITSPSGARVHSTRLKEDLLAAIPYLEENKGSCMKDGTYLSFNLAKELKEKAKFADVDQDQEDAKILWQAAKIVRKDILEMKYDFKGSLVDEQYDKLPSRLLMLNKMILQGTTSGPKIGTGNISELKAARAITELMTFNTKKRQRKEVKTTETHHNYSREPALPLFFALFLHKNTRNKGLVDELADWGICSHYKRVLQVSTSVGNEAIDQFVKEKLVCPPELKQGLFTTGNLDNIDHNPTSTTAASSFHGTAISLTNHVTYDNRGIDRIYTHDKDIFSKKTLDDLPDDYTLVPHVTSNCESSIPVTKLSEYSRVNTYNLSQRHLDWVEKVVPLLDKDTEDLDSDVSWSANFASLQEKVRPAAISSLFPMFRDKAATVPMIKHGMDVIRKATIFLNPNQETTIVALDQPLFTLAKKIQWKLPDIYGEDKFIIMMGGLHIEMVILQILGQWLEESGWSRVMNDAGVTTEGRVNALEKGSNTARGQWAHQITFAALSILRKQAYENYKKDNSPPMSMKQWAEKMCGKYPQFYFWNKTLELEVIFLNFMFSQRNGDFLLYVDTLGQMIPWVFQYNHVHYARWLSVHLNDLQNLPKKSPKTYEEFLKGHFVTQKSTHKFSLLALDQIHEQLNKIVKGAGGVIGITEDEKSLERWMVAGPKISSMLSHFQSKFERKHHSTTKHHEQIPSTQKHFARDIKNTIAAFDEYGNPFMDESKDLYTLHTNEIVDSDTVTEMKEFESKGLEQYKKFIVTDKKNFYDPIQKNDALIFGKKKTRKNKNSSNSNLRSDVNLFARLYVSCQNRQGDLDTFFKHENNSYPPSLSKNGKLRLPAEKSDIVSVVLEPMASTIGLKDLKNLNVNVNLVDGSMLLKSLDPKLFKGKNPRNFKEYKDQIFIPNIYNKVQSYRRCDIIFDVYRGSSLKAQTRDSRGTGSMLKVGEKTILPKDWKSFLRVDSNKTGLYTYLAESVRGLSLPDEKSLVITNECEIVSSENLDVLSPCNHEEADTRLFLHCKHVYDCGYRHIQIIANDSDVVVLGVTFCGVYQDCRLWVYFGTGRSKRFIAVHEIAAKIGTSRSAGLPFFHALTGCDTVSCFNGIGKKTAWETWKAFPEITDTFVRLSKPVEQLLESDLALLETFVVKMYQRTSTITSVNVARAYLFATVDRNIENIPPTQGALYEHVKRAVLQGGFTWGQYLTVIQKLPDITLWGWLLENGVYYPFWSPLPEATAVCRELIKCGCLKGCIPTRCKCKKTAGLSCTLLCKCAGQCAPVSSNV